jgi:methionyl-tRNA synthetase
MNACINNDFGKFYVTTPIYYVTARPHLGSLYSTLLADVCVRWHQLLGEKTFFLTGTDEHGQKVAQAAQAVDKTPHAFVEQFIDDYKLLWQRYELSYNHFIRTTDTSHIKAVQNWLRELMKKGDVYKATYQGWYCTPCETFVTDHDSEILDLIGIELPTCPDCGRETSIVSEESYFFKLSAYQDQLLAFYREHPDFITPKERINEVLRFVESGLKDLCISRTTVKWGVPFPDNDAHVVYVWTEALCNYISAIGYSEEERTQEFSYWWPADLQILGKDIVRFHAVYWPAFLMASGLAIPHRLLVHGWIKVGEHKMSKSRGNVVDPRDLADAYGVEPVRYYLMSQMAVTQDSSFSTAELEHHCTADLANNLGNLLHRVITLALKNNLKVIQFIKPTDWTDAELTLMREAHDMINEVTHYMNQPLVHLALARLWRFVALVNAYIHAQEPWKVARVDKNRFAVIISAACHSLRIIGTLAWPVMPQKMSELLASVGHTLTLGGDLVAQMRDNWIHEFELTLGDPLFVKLELPEEQLEEKKVEALNIVQESLPVIPFETFTSVIIVVGTIEQCEVVPKSTKLLKMQVNCGSYGMRQILSGVQESLKPSDLINTQGIFVINFAPRMMMGHTSEGMMLSAPDEQGKLKHCGVHGVVPNGTRVG